MAPIGLGMGMGLGGARGGGLMPPDGELPEDAYQQPEAVGDEGYWRTASAGYYQQPEE